MQPLILSSYYLSKKGNFCCSMAMCISMSILQTLSSSMSSLVSAIANVNTGKVWKSFSDGVVKQLDSWNPEHCYSPCNCEWILRVGSLPLAWQFFADSDLRALIGVVASYYHFDVEVHTEFPRQGCHFMCEIVGGIVIDRDQVAKLKIAIFFLLFLLLICKKFTLAKIFPTILA